MKIEINNLSKSFRMFKRSAGLKGALKSFINRKYSDFHALKQINLNVDSNVLLIGCEGDADENLYQELLGGSF